MVRPFGGPASAAKAMSVGGRSRQWRPREFRIGMHVSRAANGRICRIGRGHPPVAGGNRCSTRRRPGSPGSVSAANSPAAPERLTQAAPPLVPAVLDSDLAPAWQRAANGPVGQCPLPRLPLQIPARTTATARQLTVRARLSRTVPQPLHVRVATFLMGDLRLSQ
jgi:hypothetical protein